MKCKEYFKEELLKYKDHDLPYINTTYKYIYYEGLFDELENIEERNFKKLQEERTQKIKNILDENY